MLEMNERQLHGRSSNGHIHIPTHIDAHEPRARLRVALLGTGKMGSAIARRLDAAGFDLTVWNRTRSRAQALGLGRVAETPAEASRDADVVISSLTGADALHAAYLGGDGAIAGASAQLFIDMSTAGPDIEAELASAIQPTGARFVEAPILGSPAVVGAGQAVVLLGGDEADVERATPVLRTIGEVRPSGPLGRGARLKLVANSMLADVIAAAAELQVAGEAANLDPEDVFWVLKRVSPSLEARRAGIIDGLHTPTQFALRDLEKDVDLAMALFGKSSAQTPLTKTAGALVSAAAARDPDLDISALVLPYRPVGPRPPAVGAVAARAAAAPVGAAGR
jgi:3-hydroxyisobutyrate dehydrogenase-like beta-hydroxyacid dehydrogenase